MPVSPLPAMPLRLSAVPSARTTRAFFAWLLSVLPRALAIETIAWIVCFALLAGTLRGLKGRMKPGLMRLDDNVRAWAKTLRYRAENPDASPETARRAALLELQAQHQAQDEDPDTPPPPEMPALSASEPSAPAQTLQQSAQALAESIARDQAFNRPLMPEANGKGELAALDRDSDGVISQAERIAAALSSEDGQERVPRTWFFRFWTNFASAPALATMSLAIPLLAAHRAGGVPHAVSEGALRIAKALPVALAVRSLAPGVASTGLSGVASAGLGWAASAGIASAASGQLAGSALRAARVWTLPGLCYLGAMFMSFWLKRVFKRLRPQRKAGGFGHKLKDGSFPSGHSLTSLCFWAAVTTSVAISGASAGQTMGMGVISTIIVALTGLSRVYMGVHFPSDVLGGYFIGLVWCVLSVPTLRWALRLA